MVEVFFNNIEQAYCSSLSSARDRICLAVAWFTNHVLFDELLKACQRKVKVKVLVLDDILNRNEFGLDFGELVERGAEVRLANSEGGTMHNKFCIIDDSVITGSYNLTYQANANSENIVVVNEPGVVDSYCEQFETLFNAGEPVIFPYQHIRWTDVKEGDFSELRRNIFRDVIAKNDMNTELKRTKLVKLNNAYKSCNPEEIENAGKLPIKLRTIFEILTNSSHYALKLWRNNIIGQSHHGKAYSSWDKWLFVPDTIKEDKYQGEYVQGFLRRSDSLEFIRETAVKMKVYDKLFIKTIKNFWQGKTSGDEDLIPEDILMIEHARMCYHEFPFPLFNKQENKKISGISIFAIAKEVDGDNVVFYEGWDPQERGKKIEEKFFTRAL